MLKGKDTFTKEEVIELNELIKLRIKSHSSKGKGIRDKMRKIGLYGKDDWGITDMQISDLQNLINSGRIKVIGDQKITTQSHDTGNNLQLNNNELDKRSSSHIPIELIQNEFIPNRFDPSVDNEIKVHNSAGNYLICLRKGASLPFHSIAPVFIKFDGLDVIYTGIASGSLRSRDFKQHFKGNNAGRSTLRKSLGVLFGYNQIPRDKDPHTGKSKFSDSDEQILSEWMMSNLILYFHSTNDFVNLENRLIELFNPPLNLKGNYSPINVEYRRMLSRLRSKRNY